MGVKFFNQEVDYKFQNKREVALWIKAVSASENKSVGELNFIFCSDQYLLQINREFLKHNYYTDVITFDNSDSETISGDIFISIDTVRENALIYSKNFLDELHRVVIHGVLHLCGYKDKSDSDEKNMRFLEDKYLALLRNK